MKSDAAAQSELAQSLQTVQLMAKQQQQTSQLQQLRTHGQFHGQPQVHKTMSHLGRFATNVAPLMQQTCLRHVKPQPVQRSMSIFRHGLQELTPIISLQYQLMLWATPWQQLR
jgi:hypothetical protein